MRYSNHRRCTGSLFLFCVTVICLFSLLCGCTATTPVPAVQPKAFSPSQLTDPGQITANVTIRRAKGSHEVARKVNLSRVTDRLFQEMKGSNSFSSLSINGSNPDYEVIPTVERVFDLFNNGLNIHILVKNSLNGEAIYSKIFNRLGVTQGGAINSIAQQFGRELPYIRSAINADTKSLAATGLPQVIKPVQVHDVPEGWSVVAGQDSRSRFIRNRIRVGWFGAKVASRDSLGLVKSVSGKNAVIKASLMGIPNAVGDSCGVYLNTDDGALLRLEWVFMARGPVVRFSAGSGGEGAKSKEVPVRTSGEISLSILRSNDTFLGEMSAEGKSIEIGTLKWPGLADKQDVGIFAERDSATRKSPALLIFGLGNLYGGPPQE